MSADFLSTVSTVAVLVGLVFGVSQVRAFRRERRSDSLERLLQTWQDMGPLFRNVEARLPLYEGDVVQRALALADMLTAEAEAPSADRHLDVALTIDYSLRLVGQMSDLGVRVERGTVEQIDFLGRYHQRVLELVFRLEPFALLVSVARAQRFGFRLRRLRLAAERHHRTSPLHAGRALTIGDGIVIAEACSERRGAWLSRTRWLRRWRRSLIPSPESQRAIDELNMAALVRQLHAMAESRFHPDRLRTLLVYSH